MWPGGRNMTKCPKQRHNPPRETLTNIYLWILRERRGSFISSYKLHRSDKNPAPEKSFPKKCLILLRKSVAAFRCCHSLALNAICTEEEWRVKKRESFILPQQLASNLLLTFRFSPKTTVVSNCTTENPFKWVSYFVFCCIQSFKTKKRQYYIV